MDKLIKLKLLNLSEEIYKRLEVEESCEELISEYSDVFLSQFSNVKYPDDKFIIEPLDIDLVTDIIPGTMRHRIYPYSQYNLVWIDPDTLEIIDNFSIDTHNLNISSPFIDIVMSDIENGFVFEDLDRYNVLGIPDNVRSIDTLTRYIPSLSCNDYLMYSKELGNNSELIYKVFRPVRYQDDWVCNIEFC